MPVKKKIPSPQIPPKTPIVTKDYFDNLPIVIDFKYLQLANVRSGDFHNFCEDRYAALSQVSDLLYVLGILSQHKRKELDQDRSLRKQLHWNPIRKEKPLKRINGVLRNAYKMPGAAVDEFENEYMELSYGNGQRIICVAHDNVIVPLFLDPNHLICQEGSSRNAARKMGWSYPSIFTLSSANEVLSEDDEARKMILEGIISGEYEDQEEVRQIITAFGL